MALRWGIVSAGKISNDFVSSLNSTPKNHHTVVAVSARSLASAESFAKTHGIEKIYGSYADMAADTDIEIAYIGSLNPQHFELSKLMLEHGKHVLCEKPLTMNLKQSKQLIELARSKKLFLMEAIWSRTFPLYKQLRELIEANEFGEIRQVNVDFGFNLQKVDRLRSKDLGGGTILDLGIYVLQFQQFVFRGLSPIKLQSVGQLNSEGVDDSMNAIISYENGKNAIVATSALAEYTNEAIVVGTKGIARIPNFWTPLELITPKKTYKFELPENTGTFNFKNSTGLCYEAEHVRECLKNGKLESTLVSHKDSLELAELMDTLRQQIGVVFPEDSH